MERFPHKLNIQQLAEITGFSANKIDLLIQEGLVSRPLKRVIFTEKHIQELENIRTVSKDGYPIECGRHSKYII